MERKTAILLVVAIVCGTFQLISVSVAFSTDYWLLLVVNRTRLSPEQISDTSNRSNMVLARLGHSRARGLVWECFTDVDSSIIADLTNDAGKCFKLGYDDAPGNNGKFRDEKWQRLHLMRTHLATMTIAIILNIVAYVLGIVTLQQVAFKWAMTSSILYIGTAFMASLGMVAFHANEYNEQKEMSDFSRPNSYLNWPRYITRATERSHGWSYIIAWVSLTVFAICGTLYAIIALLLKRKEYSHMPLIQNLLEDHAYETTISTISNPSRTSSNEFYNLAFEPNPLDSVIQGPYLQKGTDNIEWQWEN